jgi:hypothetical protein
MRAGGRPTLGTRPGDGCPGEETPPPCFWITIGAFGETYSVGVLGKAIREKRHSITLIKEGCSRRTSGNGPLEQPRWASLLPQTTCTRDLRPNKCLQESNYLLKGPFAASITPHIECLRRGLQGSHPRAAYPGWASFLQSLRLTRGSTPIPDLLRLIQMLSSDLLMTITQ